MFTLPIAAAPRRLLAWVERRVQELQGKGWVGGGVAPEIDSIASYMPSKIGVVLDVGGNKGLWTRELLAKWGDRVGRVIVFEPSKHNFASIEAIGDPRVTLIKKALGDGRGPRDLFYDAAGSGLASLTKRRLDHFDVHMGETEAVEVIRLDDFLVENDIDSVDYAKFDIEGHEFEALRGAEKALRDGVIRSLSFEFGGTNIDTRTFFQDFWYLLTPRGYTIYRVTPNRRPARIDAYGEMHECFRYTNFIAVHDRLRTGPSNVADSGS